MMAYCNIFALYLPQFHRTPENDLWWGDGFTEWNSVRNAIPYSRYSRQPRVPLLGYYDLSDYKSILTQARLAKDYKIDGFAFYHYYSNGKILLHKPAELLLQHKEIDIRFFFSWANHDWRRTWYGYNMEILQRQLYGNKIQIQKHFNYLLSFFKDKRYFCIDNKPVISIYKPSYIPNFEDYYYIWNDLAIKNGFDGIFFVYTRDSVQNGRYTELFDAQFDFEPGYTFSTKELCLSRTINRFRAFLNKKAKFFPVSAIYNYKSLCKIISSRHTPEPNHYYGVFSGWDNTPRHKQMGTLIKNESPELFRELVENQYTKSVKENKRLLIINAWNEWSEGAYLEPDAHFGYKYLEAIRDAKESVLNGLTQSF